MNASLIIGSRDSQLAALQAHGVMESLRHRMPEVTLTHETQKTLGDRFLQAPISQLETGGRYGVFVKELEEGLLGRHLDLAVHSLKDMPTWVPPGLTVAPVGPREDVRDVWLTATGQASFWSLPAGKVVGTSALRRVAQLNRLRPDLVYAPVRGNLQTRWQKLVDGQVDALVLAAAGCHRLGWQDRVTGYFDPVEELVPAVGQGVLAVEHRIDDPLATQAASLLSDPALKEVVLIERTIMAELEGGCQLPLGVYVERLPTTYRVTVSLSLPDGSQQLRQQQAFALEQTVEQARRFAQELLAQGGREIRDQLRHLSSSPKSP